MNVDSMAMCWERAGIETVPIRNVPEDLHETLKLRAKGLRRTIAKVDAIRSRMTLFMSAGEIDAAIVAIQDKPRPTGDETGQAYKSAFPPDFSGRFPSLCEV
jgi:hypothetical protein